ncbi:hypothetical protein BGM24_26060 [Bacillus sp. FJAT-26377]|nr:hypothetical protein [Bacillus sp. FJAT-26377]
MRRISFNEGTLGFEKNKVIYEVPLEKTNINSIQEIEFIRHVDFMFPVTDMKISPNRQHFSMEIEVESGFVPLSYFKSNSTDEQKYAFVKNLCAIVEELKNLEKLVTILDDKNILVRAEDGEVKFLYRGLRDLMPSGSYLEEDLEMQVKRLSLFVLTSAKYDAIRVNGIKEALNHTNQEKYTLVAKIASSNSLKDILDNIEAVEETNNQKIVEQGKKSIFTKFPISKKTNSEPNESNVEKQSKIKIPKKEKVVRKTEPVVKKTPKVKKEKVAKVRAASFEEDNQKPSTGIFVQDKVKVIVGLVLAFVLIVVVVSMFSKNDKEKVQTTSNNVAQAQEDSDYLTKGLQYAAIQDYDNAVVNFEKIDKSFKEFSKPNQRAILFSYLMTGKYQEAINAEPKFAFSVVNYLVSKNNIDAVKNIKSEEPVIKFEQAAINKDFKGVLKYKEDINLDGRREALVVDAYIGLKQFDEGYEFAKTKGNNDLMIKVRQKQIEELKSKDEKANKDQIKKYEEEIKQLDKTSE